MWVHIELFCLTVSYIHLDISNGMLDFCNLCKVQAKKKKKEEGDVTFSWIFQAGTEPAQSEPLGVMFWEILKSLKGETKGFFFLGTEDVKLGMFM